MRHALLLTLTIGATPVAAQQPADSAVLHHELRAWYDSNEAAFQAKDLTAIMRLRDPEFHTLPPDGPPMDRAAMELRTRGFLDGTERWISQGSELDSIRREGDLASAMVRQHLIRMARRPDGSVHRVETWATQRETWRRAPAGWRLYRVDNVHAQRRLIDGRPG